MRFVSACLVSVLLAGCTADTFVAAGDAGADGAVDGGGSLLCGASTCKSTDTCCIYTNNGAAKYQCESACSAPKNGDQLSALSCTSTADCGGEVCCIRRSNGGNVSTCEIACSPVKNEVQLCDPSAQNPGCPAVAPCSSNNVADWGLPSGFGTCGGQGPP
mgnify:FL=1